MGYNPEQMFGLKTVTEARSRTTTWVDEDGKVQSYTAPQSKKSKRAVKAPTSKVAIWASKPGEVDIVRYADTVREAEQVQASLYMDGWRAQVDNKPLPKSHKHLLVPKR